MTNSLSTPARNSRPWNRSWKDVLQALDVSTEQGLDASEVKSRRKTYGPNRLRGTKSRRAWAILADQFKSLIVVLLGVAALLSLAFGEWVESVAITVALLINTIIGRVRDQGSSLYASTAAAGLW